MLIHVVYAERKAQQCVAVELPAGSRVRDALVAVAELPAFRPLDLWHMPVGVFGERVELGAELNEGDRVELYRPLIQDPKDARRQRAG